MRIARALSLLGRASRREAERLVADGRVAVNGELIHEPATLVDLRRDRIDVDGETIGAAAPRLTYLAMHKPVGVVSTVRDPHAEKTIMDLAPAGTRLYPVGRLDKDSEGLILLTNDGNFANAVTHPRYETEREYSALVDFAPHGKTLEQLRRGVVLDGVRTAQARVWIERSDPAGVWLKLVLHEGRNREVRHMMDAVGHPVRRLIRTRIGPVELGNLKPGTYRALKRSEVRALIEAAKRAAYQAQRAEAEAAARAAAGPAQREPRGRGRR
jgi:23S rRNA pseudouridine2605 synthase